MSIIVRLVRALARSRADLLLENLALRQQVTALKREAVVHTPGPIAAEAKPGIGTDAQVFAPPAPGDVP